VRTLDSQRKQGQTDAGVSAVSGRIPAESARWQWWPVHGGAGVSTLAALAPAGADYDLVGVQAPELPLVVVARTHASGLLAARAFVIDAKADSAPAPPLVGLVTVADAPGSIPQGLRQLRRYVAGCFPHAWHVGWVEAWRCGEPPSAQTAPAAVLKVLRKIDERVGAAVSHSLSAPDERRF
jgi:hypothetical protein